VTAVPARRVVWPVGVLLILAVLPPAPAAALRQQETPDEVLPVRIRADMFRYDRRTRVLTASGNVVLTYADVTIRARALVANLGTGEVTAEGDVRLEAAGQSVRGTVLTYNLTTRVGTLRDAETAYTGPLVVGPVTLRAERLEGDPRRFAAAFDAFATTCDPDDPLVSFTADEIAVFVGDKIVGRRVSLWIGDRRVLTLPFFIIFLRERLESRIAPAVGYSDAEGWSVKTSYSYFLTPRAYGYVLADWMERLGVGAGVEHFYQTGGGRGTALLYRLANRQTGGVDLHAIASHVQQIAPQVQGTFYADYFSRSFAAEPPFSALFTAFDVQRTGAGSSTVVFGSYLQSTFEGATGSSFASTLVDSRTLGPGLAADTILQFTRTTQPGGRDDELVPRLALAYATPRAFASLVLETRWDLDGDQFTGDQRYVLERLPEFTVAFVPVPIGATPFAVQVEGGTGRFRETTVGLGGRTLDAVRTDLQATVSGPVRVGDRGVLGVRAFARGSAYTTGDWRLLYGGRTEYLSSLTDQVEARVLYSGQSLAGASPFVFDDVGSPVSFGEASLSYRTPQLFASAAASYDFLRSTPGQLTARMIYLPRPGWTIGAAAVVDLTRRELDRLEAAVDVQLGTGWRLQYVGYYDGFTHRVVHDRVSVSRIFCDCLGVSLTHFGTRSETWLEFWLTAVPWGRGRIGLGGRGNFLFDQPLPYVVRP
jgi:hypothetical protein